MKFCILLVFGLALYACSDEVLLLDFSHLPKPEITWELDEPVDSAISFAEYQFETKKKWGCYMETNKEVYELGEEIELTLINKDVEDATPVYLYPTDEEAMRQILAYKLIDKKGIPKEDFDQNVISKNPLVVGYFMAGHHDFYSLHFYGLPNVVAKEYGYEPYEKVVMPGESLKFRIQPPEVKGTYVIYVSQFSHDKDGIGVWGMNKYVSSNLFEIR